MTQRPEQAIQRAVFEHLRWHGAPNIFSMHVPNGGWRTAAEGAILKSIGTRARVPDVIIIKSGQVFALELKADAGRLTEIQRDTIEAMEAAGATCAVVHGLDEALARLTEWGLLRERGTTRKFDAIGRPYAR